MSQADQILAGIKVLVVEDEQMLAWSIENHLSQLGCEVKRVHRAEDARREFRLFRPDVAVCDLRLPDGDGMDLLSDWKAADSTLPVILMTAHGGLDSAIHAVRLSAFDYLQKPFDLKDLSAALRRAAEVASLRQKVSRLEGVAKGREPVVIEGRSKAMQKLREVLRRIAKTNTDTILVSGETGVGKELAAQALHEWSSRARAPYVEINCASIPETLLESELFGYERGAFTDARQRKLGLFEMAHGGTIFLDEIGEMPIKLQVKLLRALEYRRFRRLGGVKDIEFNARIVAATNRDLLKEIASERFRADLYYRLNVVAIEVPPLRQRRDDIPVLVEFFLKKICANLQCPIPKITGAALECLSAHPWPGNVRELRNVLHRAIVMHGSERIDPEHLKLDQSPVAGPRDSAAIAPMPSAPNLSSNLNQIELPDDGLSLVELERNLLQQALRKTRYNQKRSAALLGISRHTLRYRLEKHKLLDSL